MKIKTLWIDPDREFDILLSQLKAGWSLIGRWGIGGEIVMTFVRLS